jgi:ligand-binding sensor domain-containing protein/DNA-binding CsgD family transcriptional regulator
MSYLKTLLIYSLFTLQASAASFIPVITNFSSNNYDGGLQNWSIEQGKDGSMYFGNNVGVLSFDGYNWGMAKLPGNAIARSLLVDGDRLYVGSYENFGYFVRDKYGQYVFTSLWSKLKKFKTHNDEIWKIVKAPDGRILFQSFCSWFEYNGTTVTPHYSAKQYPLFFFNVNKKIYVQLMNGGFCTLAGSRFHEIISKEQLDGDDVYGVMQYDKGHLILCTEFHGLYLYNGKTVVPFKTDIDSQLKVSQINRALITNDGQCIVIGTILGGIYAIDRNGHILWHYDTNNMLRNNTVLGLYCDADDNVWVALDAGLALIHRGGPYTLLSGKLGMVYDVFAYNGNMLIATNQNTCYYSHGNLLPIANTEGQNWHLSRFGSQIIVGNNHGTRIIKGLSSSIVSGGDEASSTAIKRLTISDEKDYLIEASYAELRIYCNQSGEWRFQNTIQGFMAPIRQLEVDNHGVIWAGNMNKGCYRIELSSDMKKVSKVIYYNTLDGKLRNSQIHIMKILGEVVLSDGNHLYRISDGQNIVPFTSLNKVISQDVVSATVIDNHHFWLSTSKGYALISHNNGKFLQELFVPASFFGLECGDNMNNVRVFGDASYFCLNGGVGKLDMNYHRKFSSTPFPLKIKNISYISANHELHDMDIFGKGSKAYGNVKILLSYPNYNNAPLTFTFKLEGGGLSLVSSSTKPEILYTTLNYGSYTFCGTVKDTNGKVLGTVTYGFKYPRPWYLSYLAFMLYICLFLLIAYWYVKWRTNKILRKHTHIAEQEKMKQELKLAEQQRIIESQHKQLLEQQLQEKGREIATMAMDAMKGGEDNDEYWALYRENFDLIHKQFFRHLREQYPTLTATDLKFCALLRLNLSTKDMAKYTGLSVRGMESARYRLRKKLGISEQTNLTTFLIDFK